MGFDAKSIPITLLIPVKNGNHFLPSFMPQLLANVGPSDEVIFVNDGSTDKTESSVNKWKAKYPFIRLINNQGSGLISALNLGVKESTHEWIARFDVDDSYPDFRIEKQRQGISTKVVAIFSDYVISGAGKKNLGTIYSPVLPLACSISLASSERTAHPSSMFNKSAFLSIGGYRREDHLIEDLSLWLRLSRVGDLVSIPTPLLNYNLNRGSVSMMNRAQMIKKSNIILSEIGLNPVDLYKLENLSLDSSIYADVSKPYLRTLLFVRDIMRSQQISRNSNISRYTYRFLFETLREPFHYSSSAAEILHGKLLRDCFRRLPNRSHKITKIQDKGVLGLPML
jgi:glycosyltransferase involved in cell wall biosynthesis